MRHATAICIGVVLIVGLAASIVRGANAPPAPAAPTGPTVAPADVTLNGKFSVLSGTVGGFCVLTSGDGPQVAWTVRPARWVASVRPGEEIRVSGPLKGLPGGAAGAFTVCAEVTLLSGARAEVELSVGDARVAKTLSADKPVVLELAVAVAVPGPGENASGDPGRAVCMITRGGEGDAAVRWRSLRVRSGGDAAGQSTPLDVALPATGGPGIPPPVLPPPRPGIEREMLEADWRMQDGIDTVRNPATYAQAVEVLLRRGSELIADLTAGGVDLAEPVRQWRAMEQDYARLSQEAGQGKEKDPAWEDLWLRVHAMRRRIALANPLAHVGPVLFVKQLPASFSHQLTQYYGRYARPGGGMFVLDSPGESMACRELAAGVFGEGSFQYPEVSYDGRRIMFAWCDTTPPEAKARHYHLYEMTADGRDVRKLTDGPYDDFSPRWLPSGRIVFISTRRGGFHRCGSPGCPVYTLATAEADGSGVHMLSYHETQEWDPAVLNDGRIIYTRWDYVDRHAVFGEHLWTTRPDGTAPATFYGNMTRNPVGTWEPQAIPGSRKVMATAAAHHAMTSGSIVLVDVDRGGDGLDPLTRLTPDVPFPESEFAVQGWYNPGAVRGKAPDPPENRRWPGHTYRTPWPMSESYFLAAYSYDALIGEPRANPANMFGLYLVDRFGNKELLYRDLNVASLWPVPLRARPRPPVLPDQCDPHAPPEGTFVVRNVYAGDPALPPGSVRRLRITQVLPKSTEGRDNPPMGNAGGSPGKQVLGTVPVEADGSAQFVAPARVPLLFQALDDRGQAVQVMRSATYLQPGESASCVGCHEPRTSGPAPAPAGVADVRALARPPSHIEPGPEGSRPYSYPLLVQPVLDRHCVRCHSGEKPPKGIVLTGDVEGHYTRSYNALAARVPSSNDTNGDALSLPGRYGARGSPVMRMVLDPDKPHNKVALTPQEVERLATWMDTNALFYGTFDPADQARQQRGEKIAGPKLE